MKCIGLWFAMGVLTVVATNAVGANAVGASKGDGQLSFIGAVVNDDCGSNAPMLGTRGGAGSCETAGVTRAVYMEQTSRASDQTGIAMLDYFADRPDGGRKMVVMREYR